MISLQRMADKRFFRYKYFFCLFSRYYLMILFYMVVHDLMCDIKIVWYEESLPSFHNFVLSQPASQPLCWNSSSTRQLVGMFNTFTLRCEVMATSTFNFNFQLLLSTSTWLPKEKNEFNSKPTIQGEETPNGRRQTFRL